MGSSSAVNPHDPRSGLLQMHWEQKINFYFVSKLNLHMTNFSLGFKPFLLRRFLVWSFDFALAFLCAGEPAPLLM